MTATERRHDLAPFSRFVLVSVGYQLRLKELKGPLSQLSVGLIYSLLLAPVLIMSLFTGLMGVGGRIIHVTIFEAAMPP